MIITSTIDYMDLMLLRRQAINESLDTVRTNSSKEQNQILFNDLVSLKRNLMDNNGDVIPCILNNQEEIQDKRRQLEYSSKSSQDAANPNLSIKSKRNRKDERLPLQDVDMNINKDGKHRWPMGSKNQIRRQLKFTQKKKRI